MTSITILITGVSKVYDGSTTTYDRVDYSVDRTNPDPNAPVIILNNPTITVKYATANVGDNKTVTITIALTGDDVNNYTISSGSSRTITDGKITKRPLQIDTAVTVNDKEYDGTTAATFTGGNIVGGFVNGESFTFIGTFADANVGNKSVTFKVSDSDIAENYQYGVPSTKTASIIKRPLTITGVTAANKEYDGTTAATFSNTGTLNGLVSPELLTHTLVGAFASASASANPTDTKTVNVTVTLGDSTDANGGLASNYSITNPTGVTAIISKKTLTVNGDEVSRKPYDGNLTATLSGTPVLAGIIPNDTVTINTRTATYDTPNASSNNKTVTIVTTLSGDKAGNYIVNDTTTTGKIDPKLLTVGTLVVLDKAYDGTTDATIITGVVSGIINSEITASLSASFASKNAIASQLVTATMTLNNGSGLASNYSVPIVNPTTNATINKRPLTITGVTAADKIYDGTTVASFSSTGTLNGLVLNETLTTTLNGSFADTDLGTSKPVTAKVTLANGTNGGLASNYSITNPTGLTASIIAPFVFRYSSVKFSTTKFSSFKPSVFGEMTPTQWKILSKTLPSGITINSKTGVISGTAAARFEELSVIVYASKDSYTARYSLSIKCE